MVKLKNIAHFSVSLGREHSRSMAVTVLNASLIVTVTRWL